jgi:hypothetical protein
LRQFVSGNFFSSSHLSNLRTEPFIAHSPNKPGETDKIAEHRPSAFVVGAGNANTSRRYSMTNRFMISAAVAALIAGTGFANAQGTGTSREAPSAGSTVQQSAPPSERAAPSSTTPSSAAPMNHSDASESAAPAAKTTQSDQKMQPQGSKNQRAQDDMKAGPKGEKSAQDNNINDTKGEKSKSMSSETNEKNPAGKDMKAEGREDRNGKMNAESKGTTENKSETVGQAGAGAKLSSEQRTKISTVIREQHVQPTTNVNFSISIGTRVPRDVEFRPLPTEILSIYPDWRGYEFFLVRDEIVVVNPRTLEIVAVIET